MSYSIFAGELEHYLPLLEANSIDALVTDPPYGIRFMGKAWDGKDIAAKTASRATYSNDPDPRAGTNAGHRSVAAEAGKYNRSAEANQQFQQWTQMWGEYVLRVLRPGAHAVVFASTRTYHRMVCGLEDAGFEIRDQIGWVFGSGFPKSHNLHGEWEGWGTALKPAWEPILLMRKPLRGTVASNVAEFRTGALNIAGCRIKGEPTPINRTEQWSGFGPVERPDYTQEMNTLGRWPANLIHDGSDEVLAAFPDAVIAEDTARTGQSPKTSGIYGTWKRSEEESGQSRYTERGSKRFAATPGERRFDKGSAARFFYCAKAGREDRNEGCDRLGLAKASPHWDPTSQRGKEHALNGWGTSRNDHPTVKPTDLMRYLCRLITPPGGTILDTFMGSGSTGKAALLEGFDFIGIEKEPEYVAIAEARLRHVIATDAPLFRQEVV